MTTAVSGKWFGASVPRKEDKRLLTGAARFVADIRLPGLLEAAIVRSQYARARIRNIDTTLARAYPGVIAVYTARDLVARVKPFPPMLHKVPPHLLEAIDLTIKSHSAHVLATDAVVRVGEPIAVVVATDRSIAEEAAALVMTAYEPLPPVLTVEEALRPDAPVIFPEFRDNIQLSFRVASGDPSRALDHSPHRIAERFVVHRQVGAPLETRGVVAVHHQDKGPSRLVVWSATQMQHFLRAILAEMLHLPLETTQVIAPDMGGSFGGGVYNEDILVPFLAIALGQPVRWIENRSENLLNTRHSRDQVHDVEVGFDDKGRILALRDHFTMDCGAYNFFGVILPYNTATHLRGQYRIDDFEAAASVVVTNKTPNSPVRGAGRLEAAFVMERILDLVAFELGMDPADVRRQNILTQHEIPYDTGIPYRDGKPFVYDSGDFAGQLEMALEASEYQSFRKEQPYLRSTGRYVGIGLSSYIEASGYGPHEGAIVGVEPSGRVVVTTGANPHGQGLETTLAQVCADVLALSIDDVTVRSGDTALIPFGGGTFASRSAVTAGSAVLLASEGVRDKALVIASYLLEVDRGDLALTEGRIQVTGLPERGMSLGEVALAAMPGPGLRLPRGLEPGLRAEQYFVPPTVTLSSGTHVALVEVDPETGLVRILKYFVVHDCGRVINPMVVDGQIVGGVAHGIGAALLEEALYDDHGLLLSGDFRSYPLPTAGTIPDITVLHQECPSPLNPLGVKGCGEGGAVGPPAAILNAVIDALRPLHIRANEVPLTPERLFRLIRESDQQPSGCRSQVRKPNLFAG